MTIRGVVWSQGLLNFYVWLERVDRGSLLHAKGKGFQRVGTALAKAARFPKVSNRHLVKFRIYLSFFERTGRGGTYFENNAL